MCLCGASIRLAHGRGVRGATLRRLWGQVRTCAASNVKLMAAGNVIVGYRIRWTQGHCEVTRRSRSTMKHRLEFLLSLQIPNHPRRSSNHYAVSLWVCGCVHFCPCVGQKSNWKAEKLNGRGILEWYFTGCKKHKTTLVAALCMGETVPRLTATEWSQSQ